MIEEKDDDEDDDDKPKLSKRKLKKLNRLSVAELKQLVSKVLLPVHSTVTSCRLACAVIRMGVAL